MFARGIALTAVLSFASVVHAGATVQLVPTPNKATYDVDEVVSVAINILQDAAGTDHLLRQLQLNLDDTDPALGVTAAFDLSGLSGCLSGTNSSCYYVDSSLTSGPAGIAFAYISASDLTQPNPILASNLSLQHNMVGGATPTAVTVGTLTVTMPATAGMYTLDVLNSNESKVCVNRSRPGLSSSSMCTGTGQGTCASADETCMAPGNAATLVYGFGLSSGSTDDTTPVTIWRAINGELTGGSIVFDVAVPPACTQPIPQSWTSIGQHGPGCTFNPACGGAEYGQDMPAVSDYSEPRSTGINKIVVVYDVDVDVSSATVSAIGCDANGAAQDTSGISMTVVAGANPNEAVLSFIPSLPGNNPQIGEIPVKYDITVSGIDCVAGGQPIADETRTAWAIFGDANPTPITVNNGDLGFVRSARDIILARPAGMQVVDPNGATGMFEIRADINNDNTVSNGDLGLVRVARDSITQPTGLCP